MILVLEIGMIVFGLIALIRGKFTISKNKVVDGLPARLLGLVALTPIPLVILFGILFVAIKAPRDPERFVEDNKLTIALIEAGIVIAVAVFVFGVGAAIGKPAAKKKKRRYEDEDEDEENYDRPRRRSRDEDDEDYERPPKRSRDDDDEDYDRPRRRRDDY